MNRAATRIACDYHGHQNLPLSDRRDFAGNGGGRHRASRDRPDRVVAADRVAPRRGRVSVRLRPQPQPGPPPPVEFNRVVGIYIATLFVVWQITSFVIFGSLPTLPVLLGGLLIIAGGLVVTFWR